MSIIIRLQNLPLEANSLDIRRFFQGLHIPDGGVHIVGGDNGDAFIAFGTDEDARQAMERNGNVIKGSRIKLLLSSRNEMQRVIEAARNQTMSIMSNASGQQQQSPTTQAKPNSVQNVIGGPQPSMSTANQYAQPTQQPQQQQQYPSSVNAINQLGPGYYPQQQQSTQSGPTPYGIANNKSNTNDPYRGPASNQQQQGFRARSRSRSRSPTRTIKYNESSMIASSSTGQQAQQSQPISSMHTGLLGSLPSQQQPTPQFANNNSSFANVPPQRDSYGYSGDGGRFPAPQPQPPNNNNLNEQQQYTAATTSWNQSDDRFRNAPPVVSSVIGAGGGGGASDDMFRNHSDSIHQSQQPRLQTPILNNNQNNNNSFVGVNNQPQTGYGHQQQFHNNSNNVNNLNNNNLEPLIQQTPQQSNLFPTQSTSASLPSTSQQSQPVKMFTLQLFDLPFNVRSIDLIKFFHPLFLNEDNIKIFYDEKGFPTGMALIRFPSPREFESALGYNNRFLGERRVQIRPLDEMNGPTNSTNNNNQPTNSSGPLIQQQPLIKQNNALMPTPLSNVEPYRSDSYPPYRNPEEFRGQMPPTQQQLSYNGPPSASGSSQRRKELVLYLKGLPFKNCSVKDVAGFFEPLKLVNIEIELDPRGRPTGNAFVEFRDKQDVDRGMEYNMKHMGRRYIELIPLLMYEKYGPNYHSAPPPPRHSRPGSGSGSGAPPVTYCVSVRGLSKHVTSKDLKSFFANYKAETYAVHIMLTPDRMNAGEAFLEFLNKENQIRALKLNGYHLGEDRLSVRHVPYETVRKAVPPPSRGTASSDGSFNSSPYPSTKPSRDSSRDRRGGGDRHSSRGSPAFSEKSCILKAKNISIKSNIEDLCAFFSHYRITPNRIKLKEDPDNNNNEDPSLSTLLAHISFFTKADAEHAHRNMDKKYFIDRKITLTFV